MVAADRLRRTWLFPRYIGTIYIRKALELAVSSVQGTLVDVGCGHRPYQSLFKQRTQRYVGVDWPANKGRAEPDVFGDAQHLPIRTAVADTVMAIELIEHLPHPAAFLREAHRILRPGGLLLLSAPFMEPLHEEPRDFLRFTPYALRTMLTDAGFETQTIIPRGGWWSVVLGGFFPQVVYNALNPEDTEGRRRNGLGFAIAVPICAVAQLAAYGLDQIIGSRRFTLGWVVIATRV